MIYTEVDYDKPNYFYKQNKTDIKYSSFVSITTLFNNKGVGLLSGDDNQLISFNTFNNQYNKTINYRPFDNRFVNYDKKLIKEMCIKILKELINKNNIGLCFQRLPIISNNIFDRVYISKEIIDLGTIGRGTYLFPLYLYEL